MISKNTPRVALLLAALCGFAAMPQTTSFTILAQDKPKSKIKNKFNPSRVETSVEGQTRAYGCEQRMSDFSIVRLSSKKFVFHARTVCPATMSIEFYEQPPISQFPLRFSGEPPITYGLADGRLITEHRQTTDLLPDKNTDYYVVVLTDSSGRKLRKAGSLSLDSRKPIQTEVVRPNSTSTSKPLGKQKAG